MRVSILATAILSFPAAVMATDWSGFYGELQSGYAFGEHTLSYENNDFSLKQEVYNFDIHGGVNAATVGYRHSLFGSRWHAGVELSVLDGDVTGTKHFGNNRLDGSVTFSSEMVVSASILLGYALGEKTLIYGQLGKAAADMTLTAQVNENVNSLDFTGDTNGWVIGDFAAVGVSRKIRDSKWYWNAEVQYYDFNGTEDLKYKGHRLGNLNATDEHFAIAVGVGFQF